MRSQILVTLAYLMILLTPAKADGPPHLHPPEHAELHADFYSSWMRPSNPNESCCNKQDCAPVTKVRRVGDRWEAQREKDGAWLVIPPHAIEQRRDSPDGRSHLCSRGVTVFCFVAGSGT